MKHALILAPFDDAEIARLRRVLHVTHESWLATRKLYAPEELGDRTRREGVHVLVVEADFVLAETLEPAACLGFVGLCRNALNHVDLEAATARGVLVVNAPSRNALAVAELTVGLMLSLARRIPQTHRYITEGRWDDPVDPYERFRGSELAGHTAGIIGLGAIGQMVARRLQAFEMRVIANDPYIPSEKAETPGVPLVGIEDLLARSDYVLVHAPPTPQTLGLLGRGQLGRMKRTAFLVNTSAAGVVDEVALVEALRTGGIAGAALDVFGGQPLPASSPLLKLDNVVLTPHIAGATGESIQRHSRMIAEDILRYLDGKRPLNLVNPAAWERRRP